MSNTTIGVGLVAKTHTSDLKRAVETATEQADDVAVRIDPTQTLSEARNAVRDKLETDVYAFLDADAWPRPGWADALRAGYAEGQLAVGGPALPEPRDSVRWYLIPDGWEWLVGGGPFHDDIRDVRNTYGANFSMRAEVFDALGGFDERLGLGADIPHGEETDLARRMYEEYGKRMQYRPDAAVYHIVDGGDVTARSMLTRAYDQGYTKARMGTDSEESDFVTEQLRHPHPWRLTLTAAAGFGALKGVIDG